MENNFFKKMGSYDVGSLLSSVLQSGLKKFKSLFYENATLNFSVLVVLSFFTSCVGVLVPFVGLLVWPVTAVFCCIFFLVTFTRGIIKITNNKNWRIVADSMLFLCISFFVGSLTGYLNVQIMNLLYH